MSSLLNEVDVKKEMARIKAEPNLPEPPPISAVNLDLGLSTSASLSAINKIQAFIESFQYNYTGQPFIRMNKSRGAAHIFSVSKKLIRESLPIQCVEAVFLGSYLTSGFTDLVRVPLSFKTKFLHGSVHRHIVLAIKQDGKWGAIGISRRSNLMHKELCYDNLADLVEEFRVSYEQCYHKLLTVYIGLPLPHDQFVDHPIKWRATKIRVFGNESSEVSNKILKYTGNMTRMAEYFRREGSLPPKGYS